MMSIFYGIMEDTIKVLMDDFSIVGDLFDSCLAHIENALLRCEECNLIFIMRSVTSWLKRVSLLDTKYQKNRNRGRQGKD